MTRTFIALEMNDALQSHLTGIIRQVALVLPGIRWVDPSSIHLTLAFLGELTDEQVAEAIQATEMVAQQARPFSYRLSHLGTFGSPRNPKYRASTRATFPSTIGVANPNAMLPIAPAV